MNGKVLSGPAAVLIIVLFFLPWATVSCDGVPFGEFSGYNLATSTTPEGSDNIFAGDQVDGDPILFVIPLIGLITLVLLGVTIWKNGFETNAGWGQIIAAFIGLLILGLEWLQLRGQGSGVLDVAFLPALWGTIGTLFAIAGGAVFDLVRGTRRKRPLPFTSPTMNDQRPSQPIFTPPPHQAIPPAGDSNYTIMDEGLIQGSNFANETILDEALFDEGVAGSETIIDEEFIDSNSDHTIIGNAHRSFDGSPQPTITTDDMPPSQFADDLSQKDIESTQEERKKPTSPPADSNVQKTEVLQFTTETSAWLVFGSGERRGEQFRLFADNLIGRRTTNDIVIDDTALSNVHARIRSENGRFFIFDQDSTNGIFIFDTATNRWDQRDAYELKNGDQIKIGRTVLHFMTS